MQRSLAVWLLSSLLNQVLKLLVDESGYLIDSKVRIERFIYITVHSHDVCCRCSGSSIKPQQTTAVPRTWRPLLFCVLQVGCFLALSLSPISGFVTCWLQVL
jgi:hypothetical protein